MTKDAGRHLLFYTALMMLTALCFFKILRYGFLIGWDDHWVVINAYTGHGLNDGNIKAILLDFYRGQYAPVNQLYYSTLYMLFGYDPFYFHLGSLLIHFLNSVLVYQFILRIAPFLKSARMASWQVAASTALLFAVHPLNLEPVAWLAASKVLLYALFYLLAILTYLYFLKHGGKYYLLTILFFVLSFGAKEQAVTLPFCLLLLDYIAGRDLKRTKVWLEKVPFLILSLLFSYITIQSQDLGDGKPFHYTYSIFERIWLVPYTITEYVTKLLVPVKLYFLYPFPFEPANPIPYRIWAYPLLIIFPALLIWLLRDRKWLVFAALFFFLHIALASNGIMLARFSVVADRYAYLASVGACLALSCLIRDLAAKSSGKTGVWLLSGLYLLFFVVYTNIHASVWRDASALRKDFKEIIMKRNDYQQMKGQFR